MQFVIICLVALVALGVVAALASMLTKGGTDEPIVEGRDCSTCASKSSGDCKIACLLDERDKAKKTPQRQ